MTLKSWPLGLKGRGRCVLAVAVLLVIGAARVAGAYDALVSWRPVVGAVGYRIYIGYADQEFAPPIDVSAIVPESDGVIRVVAEGLPLGPTASFAISSLGALGAESDLSNRKSLDYATVAAVVDSDGDGLTDAEEDVDLDGKRDPGETDPSAGDSDGDGLSDGAERKQHGTDPLSADSDGDGVDDGREIAAGTDPNDPSDGNAGGCDPATESCGPPSAGGLWIAAATYPDAEFEGAMTIGAEFARGADDDPDADSLVPWLVYPASNRNDYEGDSGDQTIYRVRIPSSGQWYLWGRFYYPGDASSNDANSFFVSVDGGESLKFGNNRDFFRKWHWDGEGAVETGAPAALDLGYMSAGVHRIAIEKRETQPAAPRLDVLHLTTDPDSVPQDEDAEAELDPCPVGDCGTCGDSNGNGTISIADAWFVLKSAVSLGFCSYAVCDVNADGRIQATDAAIVLAHAIGDRSRTLVCSDAVTLRVADAANLTGLTAAIDYADAGVSFSSSGAPLCQSIAGARGELEAVDDTKTRSLTLDFELPEGFSGSGEVAQCRIDPSTQSPPVAGAFSVTLVEFRTQGGNKVPPNVTVGLAF